MITNGMINSLMTSSGTITQKVDAQWNDCKQDDKQRDETQWNDNQWDDKQKDDAQWNDNQDDDLGLDDWMRDCCGVITKYKYIGRWTIRILSMKN